MLPNPADDGEGWTFKVAAKVATNDAALAETPAQQIDSITIKADPQVDGMPKDTAADAPPAHSVLNDTPRSRGLWPPWTPKGRKLSPQGLWAKSPRPGKDGALGHIDPKTLVTKRLPRIKIRYESSKRLEAKPGRSWAFGCFSMPPTTSS